MVTIFISLFNVVWYGYYYYNRVPFIWSPYYMCSTGNFYYYIMLVVSHRIVNRPFLLIYKYISGDLKKMGVKSLTIFVLLISFLVIFEIPFMILILIKCLYRSRINYRLFKKLLIDELEKTHKSISEYRIIYDGYDVVCNGYDTLLKNFIRDNADFVTSKLFKSTIASLNKKIDSLEITNNRIEHIDIKGRSSRHDMTRFIYNNERYDLVHTMSGKIKIKENGVMIWLSPSVNDERCVIKNIEPFRFVSNKGFYAFTIAMRDKNIEAFYNTPGLKSIRDKYNKELKMDQNDFIKRYDEIMNSKIKDKQIIHEMIFEHDHDEIMRMLMEIIHT